jgi:hypothetical protein
MPETFDVDRYTRLDDREIASSGLGTSPASVSAYSDLQQAVYQDQPAYTAAVNIVADQAVLDAAAAQETGEFAQGTADSAMMRADDAFEAAGVAQARADDAYDLADGKVDKDAGPAFAAPTAAPTRTAVPAYAGGPAAVAYDAAEITALKAQVAALTGLLAGVVTDLRANHALTP